MPFAIAYFLLALSILAVWLSPSTEPRKKRSAIWLLLLLAATLSGLFEHVLKLPALPSIIAIVIAGYLARHAATRKVRVVATIATGALSLLLALHVLPGYSNQLVIPPVQLSPDAASYSKYFGFDKGLAGLVMLAFCVHRASTVAQWTRSLWVSLFCALAIMVILVPPLFLTGSINFWPKLPAITFPHLFANLFFTCIAEEAFFRGMIQERLHAWCEQHQKSRRYHYAAVMLVAALFSAAHSPPSLGAFVVVLIAGLGYGLAYQKTRTIEAAILAHFLVNAAHFFLLTYPYRVT